LSGRRGDDQERTARGRSGSREQGGDGQPDTRTEWVDFRGSVRYSAFERAPPVSGCHASTFSQEIPMQPYDEQSELRRYLWEQFSAICSSDEQRVYKANLGRLKAVSASTQDRMLRKMFGDWNDPWIANELRDGFDAFTDRVLERVGRDCPELFYVNRCEACDRVVATPKACICGWCGHVWFARRDEQDQIAEAAFRRVDQHRREQVVDDQSPTRHGVDA